MISDRYCIRTLLFTKFKGMKTVNDLNKEQAYLLATLHGLGFRFKLLKKNRNLFDSNIHKKQGTIRKLCGCTTPIMVATAEKCEQEGLEIIDPQTKETITKEHPDWSKILVAIEGAHRLVAYLKIFEEMDKEGKAKTLLPKVYCMLLLLDQPIKDQLQESNSEVLKWKGLDFATSLLLENHGDLKPARLEFVKELVSKGVGNDAAHILAQLNHDPIPTRNKLIQANDNTEKGAKIRQELSKQENLNDAKALFPILKTYLGISVIKYRNVAYKIVDIYESISANKVTKIIEFLKQLPPKQVEQLDSCKKGEKAAEYLGMFYENYSKKS